MIKPIRHFFVNWINGMKIHQGHFSQLQKAIKEYDRDAQSSFITDHNYGLIDAAHNGSEALEYNLFVERPSKVNVSLIQLRAVTASGERIEIINDSEQGISSHSELFNVESNDSGESASHYVLVSFNQDKQEAFGIPDPDENPPRLPNVRPEYQLHLLPENQLGNSAALLNDSMVIARVKMNKGELDHDTSFIPPCRTNHCHPSLRDFLRILIQHEKDIDKSAFTIIYKLNLEEQNTELANSVGHFAKSVISHIEKELDALELKIIHAQPIEMIIHARRFARAVSNSIELLSGSNKDLMLNYFIEVSRKPVGKSDKKTVVINSVGEYLNLIQEVLELKYDHLDISRNLRPIIAFFKYHKSLFSTLSTLAYIGKKSDEENFGYVKFDGGQERTTTPPPPQSKPQPKEERPPSKSNDSDEWW